MKNCYSDLDKILKHYGCTFDDVVVENIFTTNMPEFLNQAGYRNEIYTKQFPTGSWLGVKELALPEFMIEIEMEVGGVGVCKSSTTPSLSGTNPTFCCIKQGMYFYVFV